ncbi:MAG: hypothetical protein HUK21_04170 [Fibrobacteraceae bacterium]|nr:hypothetical protein [Fibrobacteraceae bacterium]
MKHIVLKITAFIFGVALWFYVISLKDFQLTLEVPVVLGKLPETLAIASKPPHTLPITVEGRSIDLIRLRSQLSNSVYIYIDLQNAELGNKRIHISALNFSAPGFPNVRFVEPDNQRLFIDLDIDTRIERSIPVKNLISINTASGYLLADEPKLEPEEIRVSGARNAITRIIEIPTNTVSIDSITEGGKYSVPLNFSQFPIFALPSDSSISISFSVQKINTKSFKNIPINLIGFFDRNAMRYKLEPDTVSVDITGGKDVLDSISNSNIKLFMEVNRFEIEDVDSLAPTVKLELPAGINRDRSIMAIQVHPDKVHLKKEVIKKTTVEDEDEEGDEEE